MAMNRRNAIDPADVDAKARAELGFSRQLQQDRLLLPHPRWGGTRGYAVWFRIEELERRAQGLPTTACSRSLERWDVRLLPYRMAGNKERSQLDDQHGNFYSCMA